MALNDGQIRALMEASAATRDVEIDCEAFLDRMARYAEIRAASAPLPDDLRLAAEHEHLCANCREECAALVEMLRDLSPPG